MKFVDFFAGIGGMRSGLEKAGHTCVGFCEWDKYARQSYKAIYNTEGEWENHDVRGVTVDSIPRADLWSFGFPCQDISVAGKQKGLQGGERSGLFYQIMRLLAGLREEDKPEWIIAENVKNLLSIGNGFDFLRCITEMGGLGTMSNGSCSTLNIAMCPTEPISQEYHRTENASTLSDILEAEVAEKYYLSPEQTKKIILNSQKLAGCMETTKQEACTTKME